MTDKEGFEQAWEDASREIPMGIDKKSMEVGWYYALERARTQQKPAFQWQPIETAPRDGTEILAFTHNPFLGRDYYFVVSWDDSFGNFCEPNCGFVKATHWMPIPNPPKS